MGAMDILDVSGHTRHTWDTSNEDEVATARETFEQLRKKGYRAFRVGKDGVQGAQMTAFDPAEGSMLLVPAVVGG